jgi:hypothetical protein
MTEERRTQLQVATYRVHHRGREDRVTKKTGVREPRSIDEVSSGAWSLATLTPVRRRRLYEEGSTGIQFSQLTKESRSVGLLRSNLSVGGRKKSVSALHCCYSR